MKLSSFFLTAQFSEAKAVERTRGAYLVVARDICERDDVHPKSKHELAKRIAMVVKTHYFDN